MKMFGKDLGGKPGKTKDKPFGDGREEEKKDLYDDIPGMMPDDDEEDEDDDDMKGMMKPGKHGKPEMGGDDKIKHCLKKMMCIMSKLPLDDVKEDFKEDDDDVMVRFKEDGQPDWEMTAKQLMQAISMIDTHTDAYLAGTEKPEGALDAIDSETSRLLWGKQDESNPMSSYQNANYMDRTANGFMMKNMAELFNPGVYGDNGKKKEDDMFSKLMNMKG